MTDTNIVNIHGKQYMTVAGRLQLAHEACKKLSISTEVIPNDGMVIIKATVTTDKGTFTGISAANPSKAIEKMSPYEVAETSAVGRALGFAGFGAVDSIASADEMKKVEDPDWINQNTWTEERLKTNPVVEPEVQLCKKCGKAKMVLNPKTGKFFCEDKCWLKDN